MPTASRPTAETVGPFPDSPRVVYRTNPLAEVICQLKFPPILKIETELPAGFQDAIRGDYPVLQQRSVLPMNLPPQMARLLTQEFSGIGGNKQFQFVSIDNAWKVVLNREFIALSTTRYTRWEDFRGRLERVLSALQTEYKPVSLFLRIGLRYRDLIRRSDFGNRNEPWTQLLQPHVLGELSDSQVEPSILQAARQTLIALGHGDAQVRLVHGLVVHREEVCYSIDSDFFTEERTEAAYVFDALKIFTRDAGRLFRWCITERLHNALGPEVIT